MLSIHLLQRFQRDGNPTRIFHNGCEWADQLKAAVLWTPLDEIFGVEPPAPFLSLFFFVIVFVFFFVWGVVGEVDGVLFVQVLLVVPYGVGIDGLLWYGEGEGREGGPHRDVPFGKR